MSKVFVGGLQRGGRKDALSKLFSECGEVTSVWIARKPPGFAFVQYEEEEAAGRAVEKLHGYKGGDPVFARNKDEGITVQISTGGEPKPRPPSAEGEEKKGKGKGKSGGKGKGKGKGKRSSKKGDGEDGEKRDSAAENSGRNSKGRGRKSGKGQSNGKEKSSK